MNDLNFSLATLEAIYEEAKRNDMTFAERAGLYAATRTICSDFERHIDEDRGGHGYAHQKVTEFRWHIGAALGFDVTNGLPKEQHLSSALGAFWTLRDVLTENTATAG